ncbi:MAG: hypothetical protein SGJ02_12585 [bacterium]|nr:hypothetical protein [bacterium]
MSDSNAATKSALPNEALASSEVFRIESYLDAAYALNLDDGADDYSKIATFLKFFLQTESGSEDLIKARAVILKKIIAEGDFTQLLDSLLSKTKLLSDVDISIPLSPKISSADKKLILSDLRKLIESYGRRRFIALASFEGEFPYSSQFAKIFAPSFIGKKGEPKQAYFQVCLGIYCFGFFNQQLSLRARARGLAKSGVGSHGFDKVVELFHPVKSFRIDAESKLFEILIIDIPIELFTAVNIDQEFEIEIALCSPTGSAIDRVRITTDKSQVGNVSKLKKIELSLNPKLENILPIKALNKAPTVSSSDNLISSVDEISLIVDQDNVNVSYDLNLESDAAKGGCYLILDFLDKNGDMLPARGGWKTKDNVDSEHENYVSDKLAFKRFIPISGDTSAKFHGEIRLPRKKVGVGIFRKEIFLDAILFNSFGEKLDQRECCFRVSAPTGRIGGFFGRLYSLVFD